MGRLVIVVLILAFSFVAHAIPYPFAQEVAEEVQSVDFLTANDQTKKAWIDVLNSPGVTVETVRDLVNSAIGETGVLSKISKVITVPKSNRPTDNFIQVNGQAFSLNSQHAIMDLSTYVENRLGPQLFSFLKGKTAQTLVLGSAPELLEKDLARVLPQGRYEIQNVPSLYEKWGIYRFWITRENTKSGTFVFLVPPSMQYVRHYVSVINSATNSFKSTGYLSSQAQADLKTKLSAAIKPLKEKAGETTAIFFGYERNWINAIKDEKSAWKLKSIEKFETDLSLDLQVIDVEHKATGKAARFISISPYKTVWGELASFYYESLLELHPKVVLFLGSAGALRADLHPYRISIPKQFYSTSGKVKIDNWLLANPENVKYETARHGMTYSPIQQNKSYVATLVKTGIETLDVEQVIVARTIQEHNSKQHTNIFFGAVNVITDQPGNILLSDRAIVHSLDQLDPKAKEAMRSLAVSSALGSLDYWVKSEYLPAHSCLKILN